MFGSQIVALVLWFHYEPGPVRLDRMIGDIELICFKGFFFIKVQYASAGAFIFPLSSAKVY